MSAHEPTRLGKLLSILLFIHLLLFGAILVLVFMNRGSAQWSIVILSLHYFLHVVLWLLLCLHAVLLFLRKNADGNEVLLGIAEAVLLCCMVPEVFTAWQAFTTDPGLLFSLFRQPLYFRLWLLSGMVSVFVLLVMLVGPKWLKKAPEPRLTLANIENAADERHEE